MVRFVACLTLFVSILAGAALADAPKPALATFAGGCFWSMQRHFDGVDGVVKTVVGYTGGPEVNPSYEDVSSETTGHAEAIEVTYDPAKTSYEKLLASYWHYIDPTTKDGQFCDFGHSYRTAIFTHDADQKRLALASKAALEKSDRFKGQTIVTEVVDAGPFYPAEEYHQEFYKKNPVRYTSYRIGCGRDAALAHIWGDEAGK
ncbi:MAG: peptide-methionine (S)-S-oxide reductase MsrA [Parvibaculum sp.]|uniref:peptide-methionine (S)-S-oxide reductase MsrA n=1 Tax=Parvibaculum sp. TaxID=2024848 RepID=UPI002846B52D|nr:peptide-methionine (S)-S-oxide reductase MsrA [Parvibaculum sp.]MDR3500247.1 peptide-methionine (S)-S-oxide reductase MsrA [Parvibaculum sp.]